MANISGMRLVQYERSEKELVALRNGIAMQPFVEEFKTLLGVMAATRPFSEWTDIEKAAFKEARRRIPTGGELYLNTLPS